MAFFDTNFQHLRLSIGDGGLRRAQFGALGAIVAHFSVRDDPAVISMPTGSGKTVVMAAAAFLLRAKRVLVLTPSRLVRTQIAQDFRELGTLRRLGVLTRRADTPRVLEVFRQVRDNTEWNAIQDDFDVVVAVPRAFGPAVAGAAVPPADLFDVVLVDEAHHSAAPEWTAVLEAFPNARRLLFTATPFRRDQLEIRGRFVYSYPLREALQDKVFGRIKYQPVSPVAGESDDVAVAHAAEAIFREDQRIGLAHCLMVRTDSKKRVRDLKRVYAEHTSLRLETITSDDSYNTVLRRLRRLESGEVDGVICVNMMGEGFDFPRLKIAAVHAPFKSLAVTLQFAGRFARTNDSAIGTAKFLAVPSTVEVERRRLYAEDAIWEEMFSELSEDAINDEVRLREDLETFEDHTLPPHHRRLDSDELSLRALRPYFHVKVYRTSDEFDIGHEVTLPRPYTVVKHEISEPLSAAILIVERVDKPAWIVSARFQRIQYELVIVYYHAPSGLLFICSSERTREGFYSMIASEYAPGKHRLLPPSQLHRVRSAITDPNVYSLGMAARVRSRSLASYQTLMGSAVHNVLKRSDGRLFHAGHAFMGGKAEDGTRTTIGLTSSSKVWSNRSDFIPELISWCTDLASRIERGAIPTTGSPLDDLGVEDHVDILPARAIAADWAPVTYEDLPVVLYMLEGGEIETWDLISSEIRVDLDSDPIDLLRVTIELPGGQAEFEYTVSGPPHFTKVPPNHADVIVRQNDEELSLEQYLNYCPPTLYLSDFSAVSGRRHSRSPIDRFDPIAADQVEGWPWTEEGVDIGREFWEGGWRVDGKPRSIHEYLAEKLTAAGNRVVFYDHDQGEIADFVTIAELETTIRFTLYHCKASGKPRGGGPARPGGRSSDAFEVVGQAVKSVKWLRPDLVRTQMNDREPRVTGDRFLKGTLEDLSELVRLCSRREVEWEIVLVQPGFKVPLERDVPEIVGGADAYLRSQGCLPLRVIGSR